MSYIPVCDCGESDKYHNLDEGKDGGWEHIDFKIGKRYIIINLCPKCIRNGKKMSDIVKEKIKW